ncbi:MAG: (2Fe-2S)-binding protein, partial [Deltaproteobacteria bacterium]|nr:(2Fe-2S)-binding protein [Deltaproteobacteria bacterium]
MAELVNLTIDGRAVSVPKGTNLIEAARLAGIDIPYYCYHPHLSVAGNCRMCQVKVEGQPKLTIACNTGATEGMVVKTQHSAPEVENAQRATLEFLLINHPLDCTVCDQAGHCKLQDYYYEYNTQPSRFIEDKQHKVKAEVLGPEVIYDGERCIVCTRCSRFCEEVTKTSELGVFNRGDKSVISVFPGRELNNPLSGTVVDLCPVGALTHRRWRFNTRIWYTNQKNSVCAGCSTGCNVNVAVRDGKIVHVKGRLNSSVNQEWMCDEGRYGFNRFQPEARAAGASVRTGSALAPSTIDAALQAASALAGTGNDAAMFLSPLLTLEEGWVALQFAEKVMGITPGSGRIAMQIRTRELTPVEAVLVSPDYAANARAATVLGLIDGQLQDWRKILQAQYQNLLNQIRKEGVKRLLFVGDFSLLEDDVDAELRAALESAATVVAISPRVPSAGGVERFAHVFFPGRTANEKGGIYVNGSGRLQRVRALLDPPFGTFPEWLTLEKIARAAKRALLPAEAIDERALFRTMVQAVPALKG